MKRYNHLIIFIGCLLIMAACGNQRNKQSEASESTMARTPKLRKEESSTSEKKAIFQQVQNVKTPKPLVKKNQKIIKTADVRFQVKNLAKSIAKIQAMIRKHQGYVSSAKQDRRYRQLQSNIIVRVESDKFEDLLDEMTQEAFFLDRKNVKADDVTEEFVDIQTRLKTKRVVEKRYLDILEKARTIEEILKVENQLRVIREEIEAKEGRLKFLVDQINYSTINMEIYQRIEATQAPSDSFITKIGRGFKAGWQGILSFIINLAYAWPSLLVLGVGGYFAIKYTRKKLQRKV